MDYTTLDNIRDTYPGEPDTVSSSYTLKDGRNRITGKYPQNFIEFDVSDISDLKISNIQTSNIISFRFIVRFVIGNTGRSGTDSTTIIEEWTSSEFLGNLVDAQRNNNPYFTKNKVATVIVDLGYLLEYSVRSEFKIPELYANVRLLDTINTKEDVLTHINWMVSSNDNLRPVSDFGSWVYEPTNSLGFEYSDNISRLDRGEPTVRIPRPGPPRSNQTDSALIPRGDYTTTRPRVEGTVTTDIIRTDTTTTIANPREEVNSVIRTASTVTNTRTPSGGIDYTPFNSAGRYTGETRSYEGNLYIWENSKWTKINN